MVNHLIIEKRFYIFVFSLEKEEDDEFIIPKYIRKVYIDKNISTKQLKIQLKIKRINILIYQFPYGEEINQLNTLKTTKTIIYFHFCFLTWIYTYKLKYFSSIFNSFKKSKYIVSLVPFENDYIFKQWGINSILMKNLITYEYRDVIPSGLSSKIILMIGRGFDKFKRFNLGILSMEYISNEVKDSTMKIISSKSENIVKLVDNLYLNEKIKFIGYTSKLEEHLHNASLHIFPTVSEAFGLVISETKVFGIPNILTGLDFVVISKLGTVIIYDDTPETIAKESIKILQNYTYRKKLGKEARDSMKNYRNEIIIKEWIKLIFAVYKGERYYNILRLKHEKISELDAKNITERQIHLLGLREPFFKNLTINILLNFSRIKKMLE